MATSEATGIAVPEIARLVELRHQARHLSFFPRRRAQSANAGGYQSRFRGRGMDFDEVRPYQPGDDIRTIDWRVTARTTRPHTKVFREERERPVLIAVDLRSSMFFGSRRLKSMLAAEVAATLAWAGLNANDRVGGLIYSPARQRDLRSRRSHHNVLHFIHNLTEACSELLQPETDRDRFPDICQHLARVASPGASVIIISDFADIDHDSEKALFPVARHCDLTLIRVSDPLEAELPPPGLYAVTDGSNRRLLDSGDAALREQFRDHYLRRQQQLEALAGRLKAGLIPVATDQPFLPELRRIYGNRRGARNR